MSERARKRQKQDSIVAPSSKGKVTITTREEIHHMLKADVETILVRYEPLERLYDPFSLAALLIKYPDIGHLVPRTAETVYREFFEEIDRKSTSQLIHLMKAQPGLMSVACDGVTVGQKSKNLSQSQLAVSPCF